MIFPGSLISLLSCITFLLPPECGKRIGVSITNLLSMMVFLLMVYESIPSTSEAILIAGKFFVSLLCICGLSLLFTCFTVKCVFQRGNDVESVPRFIRVWINKYLAAVLFVADCTVAEKKDNIQLSPEHPRANSNAAAAFSPRKISETTITVNGIHSQDNVVRRAKNGKERISNGDATHNNSRSSKQKNANGKCQHHTECNLNVIVERIKMKNSEREYQAEWRRAVKIIDRLFQIVIILALLFTFLNMCISAPQFIVN